MKSKSFKLIILLFTLLLIPALVWAKESGESAKKKKADEKLTFDVDGFYRLRWTRIGDIDAFPEGPVPKVTYWDQRLRLEPILTYKPGYSFLKKVKLHVLADIYDGSFGIHDERPESLSFDERTWGQPFLTKESDWKSDGFWLREYWTELDIGVAVIRVGRMGSKWGRGILANDGNEYDDDFGDNYFGDTVEGVLIGTKPIDLITGGKTKTDFIIAFKYDWLVVEDSTGDEGDNPTQYAVILLKEGPEEDEETGDTWHDTSMGIYYVHRTQDDDTTANVIDFTFNIPVTLRDDKLKLVTSLEALYIWGETDANRSINAPEGSDIEMYGISGSVAAETKKIDIIAEAGYASGDPDPFDDEITDFHFNADYNVGLIMFERVIAAATANTAHQFSNPGLASEPPAGIDQLPTNGAVTNAIYAYPRLKVRPFKGGEVVPWAALCLCPTGTCGPIPELPEWRRCNELQRRGTEFEPRMGVRPGLKIQAQIQETDQVGHQRRRAMGLVLAR